MDPSDISELVAAVHAGGNEVRRVRLPLEEYRLLYSSVEVKTMVSDRDLPEGVDVKDVQVVPDPDLDRGEGYAEVPIPSGIQRKASRAPTPSMSGDEDDDETNED